MGLSENIITPQTVFEDKGSIKIADRVIRNWDGEGRGQVPFEDIIKYSINTGMVQLGMQLGANQMIDYSKSSASVSRLALSCRARKAAFCTGRKICTSLILPPWPSGRALP